MKLTEVLLNILLAWMIVWIALNAELINHFLVRMMS